MGLLNYLGRGLLLMLLALTLAAAWLLGTEPGLHWLLNQSQVWLPEGAELRVAEVDATLWQGGRLHRVSYSDGDRRISAAELSLAWQPLKLLRGEVQLDQIALEDARYHWIGGGDNSPWRAGDLDLPVVLNIGRLTLLRGKIAIGGSGKVIQLQSGELTGRWDAQAITLSRLEIQPVVAADDADADAGSLSLQASLQLDQQLAWQVRLRPDGLNPAFVSPEVSGDISGEIGLAGHLVAAADGQGGALAGMRLTLDPLQLHGQLNGYPLSASGSLHSGPAGIQVNKLAIRSGDAELTANGRFDSQGSHSGKQPDARPDPATLQWRLKVPRLEQLVASAGGEITAQGQLSGSGEQLSINGKLTVNGLVFKTLRARKMDAGFKLRTDPAAASSIRINASELALGGLDIRRLAATLDGPLGKQRLGIKLEQTAGTLSAQASGGYKPSSRQWAGSISKLKLTRLANGKKVANWLLSKPVRLKLDPQHIDLAQLCLNQGDQGDRPGSARLCAKLHWRPDSGSFDAKLKGLPLAVLRPVLDDAVRKMSGDINGELHLKLGATPSGDASLSITPGDLDIRLDRYRQLKFAHRSGSLKLDLAGSQLRSQWQLKIGEHSADGELTLARPALDRDPGSAALGGYINLDLNQQGLIDAFFPNVREAHGSIKARLRLGGSLDQPAVRGSVELGAARALLPMAGVELSDIRLSLRGDGSRQLRLSGGVTSGPGRAELNGSLTLDAARGWPLQLTISGQRVQALDLPQVNALVNPQLRVDSDRQGIKVRGSIVIPEGEIQLRTLPERAVSASSDVVIVGPGGKAAVNQGRPVDASVEVSLGDKVLFSGFGLSGRVSGRIRLNQQPGKRLTGNGELGVNHATLFFLGERLDVERARLLYIGGPLDAPGLNVRASRDVNDTEVGVSITGTIADPTITGFASDPGITSRDALAILATGLDPDDAGFDQAVRSTAASLGAMALTDPIASRTGLDQVSFRTGAEGADDASVYVGKNVNEKLNVGVSVGIKDPGEQSKFITRYRLRKNLHLEAHSSVESSGLDLKYSIELK